MELLRQVLEGSWKLYLLLLQVSNLFNTFVVVAGFRECLIAIWTAFIPPALVKIIVTYGRSVCSVFTEGKNQTIGSNYSKTHETIQ